MPFLNFFTPGTDQSDPFSISTMPVTLISSGAPTPANPSANAEEPSSVKEPRPSAPQILVVGTENFSKSLIEYALKMGQRLDCQIIAVNATTLPFSITEEQQERVMEVFFMNAAKAGAKFSELAASIGVSLIHLMEIGEETEIIRALAAKHPGIRYVLTEPELKDTDDQNSAQVPVFDLASTRI
ncbi:MAG: hypothetical protein KKD73_11105 [Proteobacteria bacterium]|nr:hypothetical protein [Pseudomonadota bacterium]MBU1641228.1 hypothetical protein [Pseudomonadota bacterium]